MVKKTKAQIRVDYLDDMIDEVISGNLNRELALSMTKLLDSQFKFNLHLANYQRIKREKIDVDFFSKKQKVDKSKLPKAKDLK
jgi:hypothetical protein